MLGPNDITFGASIALILQDFSQGHLTDTGDGVKKRDGNGFLL